VKGEKTVKGKLEEGGCPRCLSGVFKSVLGSIEFSDYLFPSAPPSPLPFPEPRFSHSGVKPS